MTEPRFDRRSDMDIPEDDQPEKRGLGWAALVVLLVATLVAALVLAYLITVRNFPAH